MREDKNFTSSDWASVVVYEQLFLYLQPLLSLHFTHFHFLHPPPLSELYIFFFSSCFRKISYVVQQASFDFCRLRSTIFAAWLFSSSSNEGKSSNPINDDDWRIYKMRIGKERLEFESWNFSIFSVLFSNSSVFKITNDWNFISWKEWDELVYLSFDNSQKLLLTPLSPSHNTIIIINSKSIEVEGSSRVIETMMMVWWRLFGSQEEKSFATQIRRGMEK